MLVQPTSQLAEVGLQLRFAHAGQHLPARMAWGLLQFLQKLRIVLLPPHQNRGECPRARLHVPHHLRRPKPAPQQRQPHVTSQPHPEGLVMVHVGFRDVIKQQGKKQHHPTHGTGADDLPHLEATMAPTNIRIHAHQGIHRPPKQRHQHHGQPEVLVGRGVDVHAKPSGLDDCFAEQEQRRPCQGRGDSIRQQVTPPPPTPGRAHRRFGCRDFNRQSARI